MKKCFLALSLALLAACAAAPEPRASVSCAGGQEPAVQDFLYFGTDKPAGIVSADEWELFLADTFAVGFPDGFTVWPARGQWRSVSGEVAREASYVLSLVHPHSAVAEESIESFMMTYKTRFQQEAVLRVTSDVCISL